MKPIADHIRVVVQQEEVQRQDIEPALSTLKKLLASPDIARDYRERVDLVFDGYDDKHREFGEIKELRDYVRKLDAHFPFWLFFLSKGRCGLKCIISCHLLPFLTDEGKARHHPEQLDRLLTKRWFPAMQVVAEFAELTVEETETMAEGFHWYAKTGRARPTIN